MHVLVDQTVRCIQEQERRNAQRARLARALRARRRAEIAVRRAERAADRAVDAELQLALARA